MFRTVAFRVVAVLLIAVVLVLFNGASGLLAPWLVGPDAVDHGYLRRPELHRMADAQAAALMGLLCAGALAGAIRRPARRPAVVLLWATVFGGITVSGPLLGDNADARDDLTTVLIGGAIMLAVLVVAPVALYPAPLRLRAGRPHPAVGAVVALSAAGLLMWTVSVVAWHTAGGVVENVVEDDWMGALFLGCGLLVALALIALQLPGWGWLAGATVATGLYTGVASIVLPDAPTGWGAVGGTAGIGLSAALAAAAGVQARTATRRPVVVTE